MTGRIPHSEPYRIVQEILEALEPYKPMCPRPGTDRDEIMHYSGKVELASRIRNIIEGGD